MVELDDDWAGMLRAEAGSYARVALANIKREFPAAVSHTMNAPGDFPYRPRARTPVFFGSYDWHSCVEMHWLLVRLLRAVPDSVPSGEIRAALGAHFQRPGLAAEEEFICGPDGLRERPYGWSWALALMHETATWDDPQGQKWAAALAPLAAKLGTLFLGWLPRAAYPVRHGVHSNTAFGLSRALPYAQAIASSGNPELLRMITDKAYAWFGSDILYPAMLEPSGQDFLSPALTEAELMARLLPAGDFTEWLGVFLPSIERSEPATLFTPVTVPDGSDGYISHLHGLNASRAWCWRQIAKSLPAGDPRARAALAAARDHAKAVLPYVTDSDYMVGHWLAAYAVLMLSD
ncbi:MAG TPA: DUF2891 domain-containing protein [Streptosporangiaceae bacterium]|jgi:hypothetical protein|nr:DUF2891 domain-containing protein [Streptosporangiaceae bacterium]